MNKELIIKRCHVDYDIETIETLSKISDYPLIHELLEDQIFSKLVSSKEEYNNLINELKEILCFEDVFEDLDDNYFDDKNLIIMFSDERSGSNKLELKDISLVDDTINVLIERTRGLTMDMAYLFILLETDIKADKVKTKIITKQDEGGFFL